MRREALSALPLLRGPIVHAQGATARGRHMDAQPQDMQPLRHSPAKYERLARRPAERAACAGCGWPQWPGTPGEARVAAGLHCLSCERWARDRMPVVYFDRERQRVQLERQRAPVPEARDIASEQAALEAHRLELERQAVADARRELAKRGPIDVRSGASVRAAVERSRRDRGRRMARGVEAWHDGT